MVLIYLYQGMLLEDRWCPPISVLEHRTPGQSKVQCGGVGWLYLGVGLVSVIDPLILQELPVYSHRMRPGIVVHEEKL